MYPVSYKHKSTLHAALTCEHVLIYPAERFGHHISDLLEPILEDKSPFHSPAGKLGSVDKLQGFSTS